MKLKGNLGMLVPPNLNILGKHWKTLIELMKENAMSGNFSRNKGQRAERQAIALLQPVVNKVYGEAGKEPPVLMRNLMQTNKGGYDIEGLDWIALEVKHHENLNLDKFWEQTIIQAKPIGNTYREPILMYKSNNVRWRVRMYGHLPAGQKRLRCPVDVSLDSFLVWFELRLKAALASNRKADFS